MSVVLTEKAAAEVKKTMEEQSRAEGTALRIGVASGGCSGYDYVLVFEENVDENNDSQSEQHGVNVVVDKKSALFLEGTTVDFIDGIDKRGFNFTNPNAVKTCGCGSSFQV